MQVIKVASAGVAKLQSAPLPQIRPGYVLVRVAYVSLNPTDWKHVDFLPSLGATVGCDYSGTVEEVGSMVKTPWKKGDRIAGFTHGVNAASHLFNTSTTALNALVTVALVFLGNLVRHPPEPPYTTPRNDRGNSVDRVNRKHFAPTS
ncbi:hypothetical protein LTR35_017818 [Friedmanniomyces endolithicus]|nr:hypothetical protein LTR35_017818 [Friedmanniomyces endolithicus]KAK0268067.1 hypothetical protein LTS00_017664 [Friedmanniomyces endolithicus]KAK0971200.1 hypothetical protein LTR54_017832 [Friedmanniomyces endolithicus]